MVTREMKYATISTVAKGISHADFGFTAALLARATGAVVSGTQDVMYSIDGATDPTATVGHPIAKGQTIVLSKSFGVPRNLRFIRSGSADAVMTITLTFD
jgi:hypothetical protein